MDEKQRQAPRALETPPVEAKASGQTTGTSEAQPEIIAGEGALPAVLDEADSPSPETLPNGKPMPPPIPVVDTASAETDPDDPEIKPPEIERSLDRAKENLLAYIGERSPNFNRELIQKAIDLTMIAHKNQFRKSGMPYAEHPFEVAKLLADLNMD